jgi:hypothetical protein
MNKIIPIVLLFVILFGFQARIFAGLRYAPLANK